MMRRIAVFIGIAACVAPFAATAQDFSPASETTQFAIDSFAFILAGLALLLGAAGLALRDLGLAPADHIPAVGLRMVALLGAAPLAWALSGAMLLTAVEPGGLLGPFAIWAPDDLDAMAIGRASGAIWLAGAGLAVFAASIISGALSGRVKLWAFFAFALIFSGLILPIAVSWSWGGGYLAQDWGMADRGGAVLHLCAGAAALAGVIVVGPRPGKYPGGVEEPTTALALVAAGAGFAVAAGYGLVILRLETVATVDGVIAYGRAAANLALAVAGACAASLGVTKIVYRRSGLVTGAAAVLAGLASIAAEPIAPAPWQALLIGAFGGVIVAVAPPFLDRFRIDDVNMAASAHLFAGLWGVMVAPWSNPDIDILGQLVGGGMTAGFAFIMSALVWAALRYSFGVRLPQSTPTA